MKDFESWVRESPTVDRRLEVEAIFKPYGEGQFGDRIISRATGSEHVYDEEAYGQILSLLERQMPHRTAENIKAIVLKRMPQLWLWAGR